MWMVFSIVWSKHVYVVCFRWKLSHEIFWWSPTPLKNTCGIRPRKYQALISYSIRCMNVMVHFFFFLDAMFIKSSTSCLYRGSESYCKGQDGICIRLYFPERLNIRIMIFIYIPKIDKWIQPLDTKHVMNQSMKGPCKHRTGNKRKHIYIQEQD